MIDDNYETKGTFSRCEGPSSGADAAPLSPRGRSGGLRVPTQRDFRRRALVAFAPGERGLAGPRGRPSERWCTSAASSSSPRVSPRRAMMRWSKKDHDRRHVGQPCRCCSGAGLPWSPPPDLASPQGCSQGGLQARPPSARSAARRAARSPRMWTSVESPHRGASPRMSMGGHRSTASPGCP